MDKNRDTRSFRFSYSPLRMEEYYTSFENMLQKDFDYNKNGEKYREDFREKYSFDLLFYNDYNHVKIEADQDAIEYYSSIFVNEAGFVPVDDAGIPENSSLLTVFCFDMSSIDLPSRHKEGSILKGQLISR